MLGKEPDSKYQFTYPKEPPAIEDYYNFDLLEPKEEYLIRNINRLLEEYKSKIIIFTEYLSTLQRLESVFERHNIRFLSVNGKIRQNDRHEIIRQFKNDKEINVLLATDVAGEGLNMQFANLQINYDLPWSPLKLEQRFGRLHRYGQKKTVYLINLYVENTLDSRIVELLINKFYEISKRLGVDWIFDYIGDFVGEREILQVIQGNPISIDMNKISYIRSSVASPKEINLDYVKEFIKKNEYILNKNNDLFNIIYLIDNARQIAEECNTKYIS
ncbi:Helicase superfamily c-terminal domain protein [Acidianus hospitalis W1]|uniref:Helicase superfamily c-terminal domain protein n=1 Tax=Acidianus hospitalis (strain W1) TaxID=933801 RepID=F4B6U3_ACIHW|nr:C-terminal helicase domain-containing protein [Acidianus hospitalis]AEE94636.1 Helicase superfamily c-terminal domain protein [Acidianus hospitalis W1]